MSKEPELKARDKVVLRMTRDGAVEENLTAGTEQRVSKRLEDAELVKPVETAASSEALSPEELKKVQMRRQQRQFQTEHAEDKDTQPPSETSVTEEKRTENPPQNVPEPLPSSETPFKPPTLEQHGVSSHTGTVIAETVVTHKLRKTSAVEAVDADASIFRKVLKGIAVIKCNRAKCQSCGGINEGTRQTSNMIFMRVSTNNNV